MEFFDELKNLLEACQNPGKSHFQTYKKLDQVICK